MLHGAQQNEVDLSFSIPSVCSDMLQAGQIDIGLVPTADIARQDLEIVPGVGIACKGAVRSILLLARTPWSQVKRLAADVSSRTSVELGRIILREKFGIEPEVITRPPNLDQMIAEADAALIIGDPALRVDIHSVAFEWLDLGSEWFKWTGLPMVFAAWAGHRGAFLRSLSTITCASYEFGRAHLSDIATAMHAGRGITLELAEAYLCKHLHFELGTEEYRGMEAFWELANLSSRTALAKS